MEIYVNSDKNVKVDDRVVAFVRDETTRSLVRHKERLTRVNFHLSDVNSHKFGLLDKRCLVEAHPAGRQPLVVTVEAPNVRSAIHAALTKLQSALERALGRSSRRAKSRHEETHPSKSEVQEPSSPQTSARGGSIHH